jgi:hypothetical protein
MISPRKVRELYCVPTSRLAIVYTFADISLSHFLFVDNSIIAFWSDILKSKFGHLRHLECEVGHTVLLVIQLFI